MAKRRFLKAPCPFNKYLPGTYSVPGTKSCGGDRTEDKTRFPGQEHDRVPDRGRQKELNEKNGKASSVGAGERRAREGQ